MRKGIWSWDWRLTPFIVLELLSSPASQIHMNKTSPYGAWQSWQEHPDRFWSLKVPLPNVRDSCSYVIINALFLPDPTSGCLTCLVWLQHARACCGYVVAIMDSWPSIWNPSCLTWAAEPAAPALTAPWVRGASIYSHQEACWADRRPSLPDITHVWSTGRPPQNWLSFSQTTYRRHSIIHPGGWGVEYVV